MQLMIETGGFHGLVLWLCGNFHSKPLLPFYQGLTLPSLSLLLVNQRRWQNRETPQISTQKSSANLDRCGTVFSAQILVLRTTLGSCKTQALPY